jgi:hypothetical protein
MALRRMADASLALAERRPDDPNDDGLSGSQQILIAVVAALLLGGIAFAILRDARASAPADRAGGLVDADGERIKGTRAPPKRRVQQGRKKAKAARRARKRNR